MKNLKRVADGFVLLIEMPGDFFNASVLACLARYSSQRSYGARICDFKDDNPHLSGADVKLVLQELLQLGLITVKRQQIGTAGITDLFYKLTDSVQVQLHINVNAR